MWALVEKETNKVIACVAGVTYEKALQDTSEYDGFLVEMNLENSPAYVNGEYINGKFMPPKELING